MERFMLASSVACGGTSSCLIRTPCLWIACSPCHQKVMLMTTNYDKVHICAGQRTGWQVFASTPCGASGTSYMITFSAAFSACEKGAQWQRVTLR
eukprot:2077647-Karenia_brevis.AAC.1